MCVCGLEIMLVGKCELVYRAAQEAPGGKREMRSKRDIAKSLGVQIAVDAAVT